jgi:DNA-binding MarR family transcriptional regulator
MQEDNLTAEDYQALAEFRYHIRRFMGFSEQRSRAAGVEPQQHQLLLAIKGFPEGGPVTVSELAERLSLRHHSVVELVDRAEERGFVRRRRAEDDRRQVYIDLLEAGEDILRELSLHNRAELRHAGPALVRALTSLTAPGAGTGRGLAQPLGTIKEPGEEL